MYIFQAEQNVIPVFFVNKSTWKKKYKKYIISCLDKRSCYLLVETSEGNLYEFFITSISMFFEYEKTIEKILGMNLQPKKN